MKIKRQKQAKSTISFYKYNFNFREPYQILIDGTFSLAALKNKIQIKEQLPKYLMGEVQLCTTTCALKEFESLPRQLIGAKLVLKRFQIRHCRHTSEPVPAMQCFLSLIGKTNPNNYFIATQDCELTAAVNKIPGVPLLYIILNTMVLDKPSYSTLKHVKAVQQGELVSPFQQKTLQSLKEKQGLVKGKEEKRGKKRKKKSKNPNSDIELKKKKKKKKKRPVRKPYKESEEEKKKRTRRKKRKTAGGQMTAVSVNPTSS